MMSPQDEAAPPGPPVWHIDLMRHGEPVGGSRYRGQLDDPLSEKGWRQMRAKVSDHAPWDVLVCSPLSRCRHFAEELAASRSLPLEVVQDLREVGFGVWEGLAREEVKARFAEVYAGFLEDPVGVRPAGAEPLELFYRRVVQALESLLQRHAGRRLLVVCHAGVIRMALAWALDIPLANAYRIQVASAALTRLQVERGACGLRARLVFHDGRP